MNQMKRYIQHTILALAALLIPTLYTGCTGSFEEINTDPDRPSYDYAEKVQPYTMAYTIWATAYYLHDRWFMLDEPAAFAGYVAKMSYIDEARYQFRPGVQDSNWSHIYRELLKNLRLVQSRSEGFYPNMNLAVKTLEVNAMQTATDRWRDIPYSDAVRYDEGVLKPKYDVQEDIYPALIALAKEIGDSYADGGGSDDISTGDLLFEGNVNKWRRWANSLRLRMAIRISGVDPTLAKQHVEEILGNPSRYPLIDSNESNAFFQWDGGDANYYEPIANAYRTRKTEFCAPDLLVDHMLLRKDPRIGIYFTPTPASQNKNDTSGDYTDGTPVYRGYTIGAKTNAVASRYSVWGQRFGIDLGGFSPFYRTAEVWFHIAEAALLGWNTGGITAEEAYNKGVTLSMEENSVPAAAITAYLEGDGKFDGTKDKVWYEEWVAMFKQGMEGWSLYRRTGVPTNNYPAPGRAVIYQDHNTPPFRSPYPDDERNLNKENNAPFNAEVVTDFWGKQMWWDTRTGVH
jgi:hypothetical protein